MGRRVKSGQFWVRTFLTAKGQLALNRRGRFPSQPPQEFAHGILADTDLSGDLALTTPISFELLDLLPPRRGQARAPTRVATPLSQSSQTTLLEASLLPSHGTHRAMKGACHLDLVRPTLLDQAYHRMGLGHAIAHRVLGENDPRDQQHAVAVLGSEHAPFVNRHSVLGVPRFGKEVVGWNNSHTG
jgi:hypothetical protein